jgi:hypothetical protein
MPGPFDFTGQNINDTYERLVQVVGENLHDGTGSLIIPVSASQATSASYAITASYAFSASIEIIKEVSSSYAETASFANNFVIQNNLTASNVSASFYYGDGSNLTGIQTTPFPFEGDAVITGSLTVSGSVVDFTSASAVNINLESLSLVNPIVEYLDVTSSIASGTTLTLPNNLSYISSSTYEYLEIFMNGLRTRYNIDFVPMSNTTIQTQIAFPSGSELTFKSLKR